MNSSAISTLPDDLLEIIFITCVHAADISPVVLTHVCRLWRAIAHRAVRLWTDIDLSSPQRARHFFELSQAAPLRVAWVDKPYGIVATATRDWIWTHGDRFAELELVSPSRVLAHVISHIGNNLPHLASWTMIAEDRSMALRVPVQLDMTMPHLRSLTLIHLQMRAADLLQVIGGSPLLETIEVYQVSFADVLAAGHVDLRPAEGASIAPVHLLRLAIMSAGTIAQAYILTRLRLPAQCALLISEPSSLLGWDAILHPYVAAHLGCLSFSHFKFHPRYIELDREQDLDKGQCALTLSVPRTGSIAALINLNPFDLSHMHTVEIDNTADPELQIHLESFFDSVPAVETLVLRKRTSFDILPRACDTLPRLREIRLVNIDVDSYASPWNRDTYVVDKLLSSLRQRKCRGEDTFVPVQRLILHDCPWTTQSLALLRAEVEVIVE